jgi:hypothetical protein
VTIEERDVGAIAMPRVGVVGLLRIGTRPDRAIRPARIEHEDHRGRLARVPLVDAKEHLARPAVMKPVCLPE